MSGSYWRNVQARSLAVPVDRPLGDLTAELTRMLGDTDPELRTGIALPTLLAWLDRGVYDDLLAGLGDGMALGLQAGVGERDGDSVFRRSHSAQLLGRCIDRDNARPLLPGGRILEWGDRLTTWLLRERDLRGEVPGKGVADAVGRGAVALAALARSPHLATPELTVVLDVVADRVLAEAGAPFCNDEADRLASVTMAVLRREAVPLSVLEPWVARIAAAAAARASYPSIGDAPARNAEAFLRALNLQLSLGARPPTARADLLLVVVDALRSSNHLLLGATTG